MKLVRLLLALLLVGTTAPAISSTYSILYGGQKLILNADSSIDGAYPLGDKLPSQPTLTCDFSGFPTLTGLITGTPFSSSIRAKFAGTEAATANLAVVATGTNASSWIVSGDNLTHDGVLTGSGSLFVRGATILGNLVDCSTVSWSYQAPPSTDTNPPTRVTGLVQTGASSGSIDLAWDASSDPCGNAQCTGVSSYNIKKNGTTVATQAASIGLQGSLATTNIGSGTGTHTCSQSGSTWTLTGAGTGFDGTADGGLFCNVAVAGASTCVSADITSVSLSGPYNKAGVSLRAGTAAGDISVDAYAMRTASTVYYFQANLRSGSGLSRSPNLLTVANVNLPLAIQICRGSGSTVNINTSADHGATWTAAVSNVAISLPATVNAGLTTTATEVGTAATSVIGQVNVNNVARLSKTVTTASAGTFTVTAVDGSGNESTALTGITGTPGTPPSSGAMKFHPGTYVWITQQKRIDLAVNRQPILDVIAATCTNPNIGGYQVVTPWAGLEGPEQANYTNGKAAVTILLNAAAGCGKRIMLSVQPLLFNNWQPGTEADVIPQYILTQYGYTYLTGPLFSDPGQIGIRGFTSRFWQQAVADREIAMFQSYGATFNSHAHLEMVTVIGETAINVDTGVDGYSVDALDTQLRRISLAARQAFPNTQIRVGTNDLWPESRMASFMQFLRANVILPGGPDQRRDDVTLADMIYVGFDQYRQSTYEDLRCGTPPATPNCLPWVNEVQDPELDLWSPTSLYDLELNGYTAENQRVKNPVTQAYDGAFFVMPSTRGIYNIWSDEGYRVYKWTQHTLPLINSTSGLTYWGTPAQTPCFAIYVNGCNRN